jgi:hypothetical protein
MFLGEFSDKIATIIIILLLSASVEQLGAAAEQLAESSSFAA